jgi:hypothetical protein
VGVTTRKLVPRFDAGQQCSYNVLYNTLKIREYGVVITFRGLA